MVCPNGKATLHAGMRVGLLYVMSQSLSGQSEKK